MIDRIPLLRTRRQKGHGLAGHVGRDDFVIALPSSRLQLQATSEGESAPMAETEKHDRLRAELARLYLLPAPPGSPAGAQDSALVSPSGTVRALVLELVQPPG